MDKLEPTAEEPWLTEIWDCLMDPATLRGLLESAREHGVDISAIEVSKTPGGRYRVSLPPTCFASGPKREPS